MRPAGLFGLTPLLPELAATEMKMSMSKATPPIRMPLPLEDR